MNTFLVFIGGGIAVDVFSVGSVHLFPQAVPLRGQHIHLLQKDVPFRRQRICLFLQAVPFRRHSIHLFPKCRQLAA